MVQEWDEGVFDVILGEGQMVSWKGDELNLTGFVQSFDTNVIILIEFGGIQWEDSLAIFIQRLEPCGLLWIDDSVLIELDKHSSVEVRELGSSEIVMLLSEIFFLFIV